MELTNWRKKLGCFYRFSERWKYVLMILLIGILFMLPGGGNASEKRTEEEKTDMVFSLREFEEQLKMCLSKINGIGKVELMLSLDAGMREIYASDIRKSDAESYESSVSTVSGGSYGETPVHIVTESPMFRGAVVVCEGAGNDRVRLAVTEAVGSVCDLGADRIAVVPMQQ